MCTEIGSALNPEEGGSSLLARSNGVGARSSYILPLSLIGGIRQGGSLLQGPVGKRHDDIVPLLRDGNGGIRAGSCAGGDSDIIKRGDFGPPSGSGANFNDQLSCAGRYIISEVFEFTG